MFKLSLAGLAVIAFALVMLPAGTAAADSAAETDMQVLEQVEVVQSIEEVETMIAELANTEYYSPELLLRYKEYKEQKEEIIFYTVSRGDTLVQIAGTYDVSVSTIKESNKIVNPNLIHPGQELEFPAVNGLLYTVAEGDQLSSLAEKFEVELETIWFANALDSDILEPGMKIVIPGARLSNPTPVKTVSPAVTSRSVDLTNVSLPGLIWPLEGRISSPFGEWRGSDYHRGLDVTGKHGTPIYAAASGTVIASGWKGTYGYMVLIEHNSEVSTLYAHASKLLVKKGDYVEQGQQIARVGSTGRSTGPHLHFELRIDGIQVNPKPHLP